MRGLKIGYFITQFPYSQYFKEYLFGGGVLAAYYLAVEMAKKDYKINVFTTSVNSKDVIEKHENMRVHRYGTNFRVLASNISFGMFRKPIKHDVDIAHTHFDVPPGPLTGLMYAKRKNVPLILTYHGDWVESYGGLIRRVGVGLHSRYMADKILSHAKIIISPSVRYIGESRFLRKYRDKIVVIPNGINLKDFEIPYSKEECRERLKISSDKKILLFFNNLSPYKSPDVLLKSIPKIIETMSDVELIFAGRGVMQGELEMLSRKLGVEKNVRFTGFVENDLKPLYYKAADVFVLPSTMSTECFPLTNLEAMACSVPIVASNIGGIPDAVEDGKNGLLVKPADLEALSDAIIYLLNNDDIRKKMGRNGNERVKNYTWDRIAGETEKVYLSLMEDK